MVKEVITTPQCIKYGVVVAHVCIRMFMCVWACACIVYAPFYAYRVSIRTSVIVSLNPDSVVSIRVCVRQRDRLAANARIHIHNNNATPRHTTPHHLAATQPWHYNQRIQCIQRVSATISAVGVVAAPCGSLICLIRRRYLTSCSVWSGIQLLHTFQRVHISAAKQADRHKFSNKIQCGKATNSTFNVSVYRFWVLQFLKILILLESEFQRQTLANNCSFVCIQIEKDCNWNRARTVKNSILGF